MLYGNKDEVVQKIRDSLRVAAFFCWDVVAPSPANTAAQEMMGSIIEEAIASVEIEVIPCEFPLHGTINCSKMTTEVIDSLCKAYGKLILHRKQKQLASVFKLQLERAFMSVPRTKADLRKKHPELFPVIRRRKK